MTEMRPLLVMGTRPEAIKMAPVVRECRRAGIEPIVCFTGQHDQMLRQVTDYFEIEPDFDLKLMSPGQSLAQLTARCLTSLEEVIAQCSPTCVVAQGDTTSVLAASLAAFYRRLPFVHVEAGLRTGDLTAPWPEEMNRRMASVVTTLHCAPTQRAAQQLRSEGVAEKDVRVTGNTVIDALLWTTQRERERNQLWRDRHAYLDGQPMVLITAHRRENHGAALAEICRSLGALAHQHPNVSFVFPVHLNPQVQAVARSALSGIPNIHLLDPLPYPEFVWLMNRATLIVSDSGGVQEEAPSLHKPVVALRETTERQEAVEIGAVQLVGASPERIEAAVSQLLLDPQAYAAMQPGRNPFGDGHAAERIVSWMIERFEDVKAEPVPVTSKISRTPPASARRVAPDVDRQPLPDFSRYGTRTGWPTVAAHLAVDLTVIAAVLSSLSWVAAGLIANPPPPVVGTWQLAAALGAMLMAAAASHRLYQPIPLPPAAELKRWSLIIVAITAGFAAILLVVFDGRMSDALWMIASGLLLLVAIPAGRALLRLACARTSWWGTRVVILGSGGTAIKAAQRLMKKPALGLRPVGILDDVDATAPCPPTLPWLGPPAALEEVARSGRIDRVVVATSGIDSQEIAKLVDLPSLGIRQWIILPPLANFPSLWATTREIGGLSAVEITNRLASPFRRGLKRLFDLTLTVCLGPIILPLLAVLALLVRATSRGPVFYSQERIGWHGRRFRAWKLRTMRPDADQILQKYLEEHPELRVEWQANHKLKHDPRITWVGRWLRLTSLDELPQIWNVVRGDMSLIGPRPIVEAEIEKYGDQYEHYIKVVPGITGLWQISGRNNTTYDERIHYDAYYVKNWSLWLDLYILACTVRVVLLGEGAY